MKNDIENQRESGSKSAKKWIFNPQRSTKDIFVTAEVNIPANPEENDALEFKIRGNFDGKSPDQVT